MKTSRLQLELPLGNLYNTLRLIRDDNYKCVNKDRIYIHI